MEGRREGGGGPLGPPRPDRGEGRRGGSDEEGGEGARGGRCLGRGLRRGGEGTGVCRPGRRMGRREGRRKGRRKGEGTIVRPRRCPLRREAPGSIPCTPSLPPSLPGPESNQRALSLGRLAAPLPRAAPRASAGPGRPTQEEAAASLPPYPLPAFRPPKSRAGP